MTYGAIIDNWKLPIFKRYLDEGDWKYTEHPLVGGATLLKISCDLVEDLEPIILAARKECSNTHCPTCED